MSKRKLHLEEVVPLRFIHSYRKLPVTVANSSITVFNVPIHLPVSRVDDEWTVPFLQKIDFLFCYDTLVTGWGGCAVWHVHATKIPSYDTKHLGDSSTLCSAFMYPSAMTYQVSRTFPDPGMAIVSGPIWWSWSWVGTKPSGNITVDVLVYYTSHVMSKFDYERLSASERQLRATV